jgi:hypothetical protein
MAKDEQKTLKQRFKEDKTLNEEKKEKIRTYLQRLVSILPENNFDNI